MNVSDAIRLKRAVRKFQDKPLPDDVVHTILNSGRRSQSSKNTQAWKFIAIRDKEILKALSQCGEWAGHIAGAALCVAILTPDPDGKFQIMFDAGQAAAFMQLAAWESALSLLHCMNLKRHVKFWVSPLNGICESRSRSDTLWMKKNCPRHQRRADEYRWMSWYIGINGSSIYDFL